MELVRMGIYVNKNSGEKLILLDYVVDIFNLYSIDSGEAITIEESSFIKSCERINNTIKKGVTVKVLDKYNIKKMLDLRMGPNNFSYDFPAKWDDAMYEYCGQAFRVNTALKTTGGRFILETLEGKKVPYYFDSEMLEPLSSSIRRF